ncbi:pyridoxal phosphate-dependent aminotransferase [Myxococcota bacterium]|nr:pyridoxal phosphate-dependent aminotransferase [Myxococcota bacterium]MBU1896999.1 pyridoxal phosphate-dependent aminotransferase [Myxococcota bacterium]
MSTPPPHEPGAFRHVPRTGVIFVMTEAARRGYQAGDPEWTNLGQGQPETGPLDGAPPRVVDLDIDLADFEYAPVAGIWALRDAVAQAYNRRYRRGLKSQYSAENVAISGGGRVALARAAAALGGINLGHFLPDYTAYEELLGVFRLFSPIPILLDPFRGYDFSLRELEREITGRGLSALLMSNPCNPTGKLVAGDEMLSWVSVARRHDCALLLDEFYSHYVWNEAALAGQPASSAAAAVEDVERDPVILFDGLTKNWRYPGWRVTWTLGPQSVIEKLTSAGSFLDGGGSRPLQRAAIPLLEDEAIKAETRALRRRFRQKRDMMLRRLIKMGVHVDREPEGTFYVWGDVSNLPEPINTGMRLFRAALEDKVICVPGAFFDVDPGHRRAQRHGRFERHVRFSFGPEEAALSRGLDRLEALIARGGSPAESA